MGKFKVFHNIGEVLTMKGAVNKDGRNIIEKDLGSIKNAAMISQRGKLLWVGKRSALGRDLFSKLGLKLKDSVEVDLGFSTVLPAFTECHTHSVFAGDRSHEFELRNQGATYQEIAKQGGGILNTMKATRKASKDLLAYSAQTRAGRFLDQGVTCLEIKSGYALDLKNEIKMLKAARSVKNIDVVTTYLGLHGVPSEFKDANEYVDFVLNKALPKIHKQKLCDRVDIFIEKGYFNLSHGKRLLEKARALGLGATIHGDQLTNNHGAVLGAQFGIQSVDHLVQVKGREISMLAQSPTTCVLLPGADLYLKMEYPPARKLIDAGARVAIATDYNPGSCPTQDLSLIGMLSRLEMKMSLPEVICAYTLNSASALGKGNERGALVSGYACDFITLNDSWRSLFYSVGYHPVRSVWKSGKRLKQIG